MTQHQIYTLGNTEPVRITPNGLHSGMDITIQNINPSGYIYVGGEDLTTSDFGFRILPNHSISFELQEFDALYAIASDADLHAAVIKINLER